MGTVKDQHPGGFWVGFNWGIDRPSAGRLVELVGHAHADGYERVHLMLSSSGGLLVDAHYAVECLAAIPVEYVTWNMSAVQSAGNMLFALGVERYATPGSSFAFHQTGFEGVAGQRNSETEIREQLRLIEIGDRRYADFVEERTGIAAPAVMDWQVNSKTLTDAEAVAAGFAHQILRPKIPQDAFFRQALPNYG